MYLDHRGALTFGWKRPPSDYVQFGEVQVLFVCFLFLFVIKEKLGTIKEKFTVSKSSPQQINTISGV